MNADERASTELAEVRFNAGERIELSAFICVHLRLITLSAVHFSFCWSPCNVQPLQMQPNGAKSGEKRCIDQGEGSAGGSAEPASGGRGEIAIPTPLAGFADRDAPNAMKHAKGLNETE
ncbi:MAG TPA: hypothetical protein VH370_04420 [Humisphaera sp.]|nr:hypothetical protein [Humisphaera sp.]